MNDIASRQDIEHLVDAFYQRVMEDQEIGPFFTEVAAVDWERHLPNMYDFWETVIFSVVRYKGNPMMKHILLNQKAPLLPAHFDRWLVLWRSTVNTYFEGENAHHAIQRATQIAELMKFKVQNVIPVAN